MKDWCGQMAVADAWGAEGGWVGGGADAGADADADADSAGGVVVWMLQGDGGISIMFECDCRL